MCVRVHVRARIYQWQCVGLLNLCETLSGGWLPLHFASAAVALLNSTDYVPIKDLLLDEDDDKLTLATTLFADDLIEIKQ